MPRFPRGPRRGLFCLVALLLASSWLLPGSWQAPSRLQRPAFLFLSPNTDDGLSLDESVRRLGSPVQVRCRKLATDILGDLGVRGVVVHDAIGDWSEGVENSLLVVLPRGSDSHTLRAAAAGFGLLAEQKAVLAFHTHPRGDDVLVILDVPGSLTSVRDVLDRHGIRERTILVGPRSCRVVILDEGGRQRGALRRMTEALNGVVSWQNGESESLAGATRAEARERYREVLRSWRVLTVRKWLED